MNLNEEFHHACLDKLKSKDFDRAVLLAAGKIGNLAAVKAILEQPGAKQTCKDNHEFRCEVLKAAAASGNARLCELLVRVSGAKNFGALCDCGKKAIQAAFCEAASHCHENAAMYFYYNGASFKHPTYWDELCNAAKRNDVKCAKFLIGTSLDLQTKLFSKLWVQAIALFLQVYRRVKATEATSTKYQLQPVLDSM